MAKKESSFKNMVIALFVISAVASTTLGFVYEFTKEPIAQARLSKKLNAIKMVVPPFDNDPNADMYTLPVDGGEALEAYPAKMGEELVGVAIRTYTMNGFSGLVRLMVGLSPSGDITGISVLEHKETPGLGTHMSDEWFIAQFISKNPGKNNIAVKKDGGEVDAITAATISSRAFTDAVQRAYNAYKNSADAESGATVIKQDTTQLSKGGNYE